MDISEMLARVLAAENISVEQKKVSTASFDLVSRTLTLPMWENMSRCVELMLIEHEVGHALYTPATGYIDFCKENPALRGAINVLEDARIDRLMRERYPGTRKDYAEAMKQLRDEDFFELADRSVPDMGIVDRINIFFKLGASSGVKFTSQEQPLVIRAQHLVTFEEVKQLALDLQSLVREAAPMPEPPQSTAPDASNQPNEEPEDQPQTAPEDPDSGEGNESGEESDSVQGDGTELDNATSLPAQLLESVTDQMLQTKLSDAAQVGGSMSPEYLTINENYGSSTDFIVGYKTVIAESGQRISPMSRTLIDAHRKQYMRKVAPQVSHMVQTFESKKSASLYALRSVRKTGVLDVNKVAQYRVKEDLFLRNVKVPEGKNHGMVMLLDWSASMRHRDVITSSLEQVIQMVMFCRQTALPFRVYAFSSTDYNANHYDAPERGFRLLELFSDKMSEADSCTMVSLLLSKTVISRYPLYRTPLAPALAFMRQLLPEFRAQYAVEKLNLITFTDGANTTPLIYRIRGSVYIKDPVTKKNYKVVDPAMTYESVRVSEVNAWYKILRDRCNCTITSYFVSANNLPTSLFNSGVYDNPYAVADARRKEYNKNGYIQLTGYGRDAVYIVRADTLKAVAVNPVGTLTPDLTSAKIASELRIGAKSASKNKMLAENFVASLS